ncbi:MAG: DUF1501 domain-containing protein, partial [Isosphaeraceae bacterium]
MKRNCNYACHSPEHLLARRQFLGAMAATPIVGGLGVFTSTKAAETLKSQQKRVVVFNMHGGLSQLETWDPKPGTETGGPFRSIETSVPGIRISELMPETAKMMHHLTLVRGVNTSEDDHGKGLYMMLTGRRQTPAANYPQIGSVMARALTDAQNPLPGHILITPGGGGGRGNEAAYLGPKYSSLAVGGGKPPQYTERPKDITESNESLRQDVRRQAAEKFLSRRRTAITDAYIYSYEQALRLMSQRDAFDISKEPQKDQDRYGNSDLGRQCLLGRRLLEKGATFIQITHSNYDTHNENFNFHLEQVGEFDRPYATFINDLAERGMLESTLVVMMSEFGRTPNINLYYGRDHWSRAWTVAMAGCGLHKGMAFGKTNEKGTAVTDGQVDHANLFHT